MRLLRWSGAAGLVLIFALPLIPHADAAEGREKVRLTLLDKCVADQWKVRKVKDTVVDECKCAAAKVSRDLPADQVAAFTDTAPTSPRDYWQDATRTCFKSPAQ